MGELTVALDGTLVGEMERETAGGAEFRRLLAELGVRLFPLHDGTTDAELARWFYADIPDTAAIEQVLNRLRQHPLVVAAYAKPADEMP